ncbi:hypothetical protein B5807_07198 [Epicoccum nigrum]|uniref:Major facilitator superfamily (MFS) profile domain-containing protein n=1 Tax=Epicoccum nigrum TaxID=105696 RepID=A0A1Y2LV18_EPING|nr:hypothetical protein B5807_07198 [Epicoccum nigrum]
MLSSLDEKDADHRSDALNNKEYKTTPPASISLKTPPSPDGRDTDAHVAAVPDSERQYLGGFKLAIVLGSLTLISFLVLLDMSIIGTAIPQITTEFNALNDVGWYLGAYNLVAATGQPLSGKLFTSFSNKYTYLTFTLLFELGSLICALANSSSMFIAGRVIAGLGAAGNFNGGITIISCAVPLEKSPMYTGILAGFAQLGIVAGPLIGGALTEHVSWRWCFYINLPVGGAAVAGVLFIQFPEIVKKEPFSWKLASKVLPELDLVGFALFAPASVMFLLALQFGGGDTFAWGSATVIGLFVGAAATAAVFIAWEARAGERAMIPGSMVRQRIVWTSCAYGAAMMSVSVIASNWLPTYFQAVKGEGATLSGIHVLPGILSAVFFVVLTGAAITRLGYYLPWGIFAAVTAAIGTGLCSTLSPTTTVAQWVGYQILFGIGRGAYMQIPIVAVQNAVPAALIPIAMATLIFAQNLGIAVAVVASNAIFTQTLVAKVPLYAPSVSPAAVLAAGSGARAVRAVLPPGPAGQRQLPGLLRAYSESLRNVFFFVAGLSVLAVGLGAGMGWRDVRRKKKVIDKGGSGEEGV